MQGGGLASSILFAKRANLFYGKGKKS